MRRQEEAGRGSQAASKVASGWVLVRAWFWMTSLTLVCVWSLMQPRSVHAAPAAPTPASVPGELPLYSVFVVPQFQPVEVHRTWGPVLARIGQEMGVRFELKTAKDIPAFEAEFKAGTPDFAYMNPYHAVMAHRAQGYVPLVRDVTPLSGIVVVRKDDPIKSVKELQGQEIAFPAPNAFGASLWIRALLSEQHKVSFKATYAKTHSNVYRQTIAGRAAASGGIRATLDREPDEVRKQLRVLMETPAVAPHPLSPHPRVPPAVRQALQAAFERLGRDEAGKALLHEMLMPRPVKADYARDYQPLEKLQLERYVE
jgi:phosphonate transport system substrate-binding protein